jgi:hypothetical protein
MGGCTNCKGKVGCDHRKGAMVESVDRALEELYPTRTWGVVDDTQANGTPREELDALADELAQELGAATFAILALVCVPSLLEDSKRPFLFWGFCALGALILSAFSDALVFRKIVDEEENA